MHVEQHLRLHQYAVLSTLARNNGAREDLERAADGTTLIVETFLQDANKYTVAPITIPLVVPAMIYYLAAAKTESSIQRASANERLDWLQRFLTSIQDIYPAALILKRVCTAARETMNGQILSERHQEGSSTTSFGLFDTLQDSVWLENHRFF